MMYNKLNLRRTWLLSLLLLGFGLTSSYAQVNASYSCVSASGTYTPIAGGTVLGTTANDDDTFPALPGAPFAIGFPFSFNGTAMAGFGVDANGWISLTASATVAPNLGAQQGISAATGSAPTGSILTNVISAFSFDMTSTSTGELSYTTVGTAPNRTLVVQWKNYAEWQNVPSPNGGPNIGDNFNFQIRLNESGNTVQVVYGTFARTTVPTPSAPPLSGNVQVGLKGANVATDFNNRAVTTSWANNIAGTSNTASCVVASSGVVPASGLTLTWSPTSPCPATVTFAPTSWATANPGVAYNSGAITTNLSGTVTYAISPTTLPAGLSFSTTTGAVTGTSTTVNVATNYTITATAGACTGIKIYSLFITCPQGVFTPNTGWASATVGVAYSTPAITTNLAGTVTWNISPALPASLTLNPATGIITGTPTVAATSATYTLTGTSTTTCAVNKQYNLVINPASCTSSVVISPATIPFGAVNLPYNLQLTQTGLTGAVTWTMSSPLPTGLTLGATTGLISGTPTTSVAPANYTITATSGVCSNNAIYSIAICPTSVITATPTLTAPLVYTVGVASTSVTFTTLVGGTPIASNYTATGLPLGLTLVAGVLSGTPTTAGTGSFTINSAFATGGGLCPGVATYTYTVNCPTSFFTPPGASLPSGSVGIAYNQAITQTGLVGANFTVLPLLPAGLSLSLAGAITGSPTAVTASATYTITATAGTCTATKTYTLDVVVSCGTAVFTPASLPSGNVGTVYNQTIAQTGLTGTAIFTVLPALPAGLSLSSAGVISGTPTAITASATYTVTATAGACTGTKAYTFGILANQITAIDSNLSNLVKVSPNPSKGTFNVDFGRLVLNKTTLNVYDLRGKNVYTTKVTNNDMTISLNALANGVYLLEVISEQGRILKRLVKE